MCIATINALRIDTMLLGNDLPEFRADLNKGGNFLEEAHGARSTNLIPTLTGLDVNDFAHFETYLGTQQQKKNEDRRCRARSIQRSRTRRKKEQEDAVESVRATKSQPQLNAVLSHLLLK